MPQKKITYNDINEQYIKTERLLCNISCGHLINKYIVTKLQRNLYNPEIHEPGLKMIEKNEECLLLYPRGFGKTTFFVEANAIYQILKNPNVRIAIVSHSYKKAVEILDHIKQYLKHKELIYVFEDVLWDKIPNEVVWKENAIRVKQTEVVGNTIEVFGIEQDITGSHYDIIYFDDIVQVTNTSTSEAMRKLKKKFAGYIPILKPGGKRIIVGTRYKIDDLYGELIDSGIPHIIRKVEEDGKLLDPHILDQKELEKKKEEITKQHSLSFFMSQYYNVTIPEENIKFKPSMIKFHTELGEIDTVYIICDPAISKKAQSDETVVIVVAKEKEGMLRVISSDGRREDVQDTVDRIMNLYMFWSMRANTVVGVEKVAYQAALLQWIEKEMTKKGIYFEIKALEPKTRSKKTRIEALVPYFKNNAITLDENNCEPLYDQLINYGATLHDDHLDALAYIPDLIVDTNEFDIFNIYEDEELEYV